MIYEYLVTIVMVTYNHEKYIVKAIESVLMQECDFKFQLIISDDSSSDGTKDICSKYYKLHPDKIVYLENDTNIGLVGNYKRAFDICKSKYISILEGDDYWTDKNKLQKQVAILEENSEVGLVHGNYLTLKDGKYLTNKDRNIKMLEGDLFKRLIVKNMICNLTAIFRKDLFDKNIDYNYFIENNYSTIDYALWIGIAANSKIKYINDVLGVYRREVGSISNTDTFRKSEFFLETAFKVKEYYCKKYKMSSSILSKAYNNLYYELMSSAIFFGEDGELYKYRRLYRPDTLIGLLKWIIASNSITLFIFKKFKLFLRMIN